MVSSKLVMSVLLLGLGLIMMGWPKVDADIVGIEQYEFTPNVVDGDGPDVFLEFYKVVPGVINQIPSLQLFVYYTGGAQVYMGSDLFVDIMTDPPIQVEMSGALAGSLYTFIVVDADAPATDDPIYREQALWVRSNIPGADLISGNIRSGDDIVPYQGPNPQKGSHRVVFIVYQQFYQPVPASAKIYSRNNFSARIFANQYSLGEAVAAVFCTVQPSIITSGSSGSGGSGGSGGCAGCDGSNGCPGCDGSNGCPGCQSPPNWG